MWARRWGQSRCSETGQQKWKEKAESGRPVCPRDAALEDRTPRHRLNSTCRMGGTEEPVYRWAEDWRQIKRVKSPVFLL